MNEKELEILSHLSEDNVLAFLIKYKKTQEELNRMKKVYQKKISNVLKDLANGEKVEVENDIFRVVITQPTMVKKVISIKKVNALPEHIKDMILEDKMTSASMPVTLIEEETEDF